MEVHASGCIDTTTGIFFRHSLHFRLSVTCNDVTKNFLKYALAYVSSYENKLLNSKRQKAPRLRTEAPVGFYLGLTLKHIITHTVWGLWRHAKTLEFTP